MLSADIVKGEVRISLPRFSNIREALHFAQAKSRWLAERFSEAPAPIAIANGQPIFFLGNSYLIHWSKKYARKPRIVDDQIRLGGPQNRIAQRIIDWMKAEARAQYALDVAEYCSNANSETPKLSIGDARKRWGSCSGQKSIRLNWRLIMAPPMVRRSVVAHEVAHLRHMNHSKAFYDHLDSIFEGDRREADRWLRIHGQKLHLVSAESL